MANLVKFIIASLFLAVLLIFSQEIQSTEGRQLNLGMKKASLELETHVKIIIKHHAKKSLPAAPTTQAAAVAESQPRDRLETDFRPTTPGHSPGVGHSVQD